MGNTGNIWCGVFEVSEINSAEVLSKTDWYGVSIVKRAKILEILKMDEKDIQLADE